MSKHVVNPDLCTACTVCVAHCPVAEVVREYRGPKLSGPASERWIVYLNILKTGITRSV